ncbi:MAG: PAS domain-containing protein [Oscillochloris sp.]|nr:PAS domain-containing protein [Oscillochloris sp.]
MAFHTDELKQLTAENEQLRRAVERYHSLLEQLAIGVYIYRLEDRDDDRTLRMVVANPAVEQLTGIPVPEQIGRTLDENFPGLREQGIPQAYAQVIRSGEALETESIYGDERVIEAAFAVRAAPLPNDEVAVFFDNITARKQTELALKQLNSELEQRVAERTTELERSQSMLQHVLNSSPSAIYIKDLHGHFLVVNQRAAGVMGHAPEELLGKADYELFPEEFVAQWRAAEQEVLQRQAAVEQEETAPQPDGIHTFLSSRAPIMDENGKIYAIGGVSTDITSRIKVEEAQKRTADELRENQQLLATLFDYLPVAVILKSAADSRFVLWNGGSEQLFGFKAADIIGKTDHDIFPKEQADEFRAADLAVLSSGQPHVIPEEFVDSATLGRRTLRTTKIPMMDPQGKPSFLLVICTDLTDEKRAVDERADLQAQVIEAQQHALRELSTPLLPISRKVVLMPIIGSVDSRRASQVMETLLLGVAEHNAQFAIVDITGVQVVDTQVANAFIQAARAVSLLGAQVLLTGIRPEVAQTLVQLGVDLQGIMTRGSLQDGIAHALKLVGL